MGKKRRRSLIDEPLVHRTPAPVQRRSAPPPAAAAPPPSAADVSPAPVPPSPGTEAFDLLGPATTGATGDEDAPEASEASVEATPLSILPDTAPQHDLREDDSALDAALGRFSPPAAEDHDEDLEETVRLVHSPRPSTSSPSTPSRSDDESVDTLRMIRPDADNEQSAGDPEGEDAAAGQAGAGSDAIPAAFQAAVDLGESTDEWAFFSSDGEPNPIFADEPVKVQEGLGIDWENDPRVVWIGLALSVAIVSLAVLFAASRIANNPAPPAPAPTVTAPAPSPPAAPPPAPEPAIAEEAATDADATEETPEPAEAPSEEAQPTPAPPRAPAALAPATEIPAAEEPAPPPVEVLEPDPPAVPPPATETSDDRRGPFRRKN